LSGRQRIDSVLNLRDACRENRDMSAEYPKFINPNEKTAAARIPAIQSLFPNTDRLKKPVAISAAAVVISPRN